MYLGQKKSLSLSASLEKRHSRRAGYRKLSRCCLFPFQGQPLVPPVRELGRFDSRGGKFARFFVRRSCFDETVPSGEKTRRRTMAASLFLRARRRAPDERGKGRPRRTRVDCDSCQNRWQTRSPVSPLSSLLSSLARALSRLSLSPIVAVDNRKEKGKRWSRGGDRDDRETWAGNFEGGGRKNRRKNGKTRSRGGGVVTRWADRWKEGIDPTCSIAQVTRRSAVTLFLTIPAAYLTRT